MLDDKIQDSLRMNFFKQNLYIYIYIKDKTITNFPDLKYVVLPARINYITGGPSALCVGSVFRGHLVGIY